MVSINRRSMLPFLVLGFLLAASIVVLIIVPFLSRQFARLSMTAAHSGAALNDLPAFSEMIIRGLLYLSASAVIGSATFVMLIWRPSYQQWSARRIEADRELARIIQSIILIGLTVLAVSTFVDGIVRQTLFSSGALLWARLALLGAMAWIAPYLSAAATGSIRLWIAMLACSALLILTFSLQSHAASGGLLLPVLANYAHIAAACVWIGGLMPLAALLTLNRQRGQDHPHSMPMRILIPHFSLVAITCVTLLMITGLFSTSLMVRTPAALIATGYGRALLAKAGLVILLLILGAVNLIYLSPQLNTREFRACCTLLRVVRTELAIGLMVLVATGLIAGAAPAYKTYRSTYAPTLSQEAQFDHLAIRLNADPYPLIVEDRLNLEVIDSRPGDNDPQVMVQFGSMEPISLEADQDGRYALRGSYFKAFGPWDVTVIVRRDGYEDVRHRFNLSDHK